MTSSATAPSTTADSLSHDLAALRAALEEARDRAQAGSPLDLAGLEARTAALCEAVLSLPGDRPASLTSALGEVLAALDPLAAAMAAQHRVLAETLAAAAEGRPDPHTARQRAATVYGRPARTPTADDPPPPSDAPA